MNGGPRQFGTQGKRLLSILIVGTDTQLSARFIETKNCNNNKKRVNFTV